MYDPLLDPDPPEVPPGQDELPWQDGAPMDSPKHGKQAHVLGETLQPRVPRDTFIGANMFLYYSGTQAKRNDFRGPDFFVVVGVDPERERKSWVVWEEGGRAPDVIVELLSASTEHEDRGRKMRIYATLGVAEYILFDPADARLEGYSLDLATHRWVPKAPGLDGGLDCQVLGLRLVVVEGEYEGMRNRWLRWQAPDGEILPTGHERAEAERKRADAERERAETERERAEAEHERAERLAARLRAAGLEPE